MVDKKNLNRIKGILSARQGAEIPKFQNPAGPLTYKVRTGDTLAKIVAAYNKQNNTTFKWEDVASWNNIANPNSIQVGQTISFQQPQAAPVSEQNQTTVVHGANPNEGKPNAAVEAAAEVTAQTTEQVQAAQASANAAATNTFKAPSPEPALLQNLNAPVTGLTTGVKPVSAGAIQVTPEKELGKLEQWHQKNAERAAANPNGAMAAGIAGQAVSSAMSAVGSAVKSKQAATDSNTTKTADSVYDATAQGLQKAGGIAGIVGTAMQFAGTAGDIIQELGGGTDQQTKTDQWMDSAFFSWNIGMLNGFAGKNTRDFGVDQDTLAQVGSSYGGTAADIQDAAKKAGKKYGLFSSKARKKANAAIAEAERKQNLMADVADTANDQRLAVQSMGEQAGLAYSMMTSGGYDQKFTYAAKQGGMLEWNPVSTLEWEPQVELNWELQTFKEGGNIELIEELEWVPEFKSGNKIRTIEELIEYSKKQNPRFVQRLSEEPRGIKFTDDEGKEAEGSHYLEWATDDEGNAIVYPRIQEMEDGSLKFLSMNEAYRRAINNKNILIMSPEEAGIFFAEDPEYTTAYKKGWPDFFKKFKKGGSLGDSDIPEIEETTQKNVIPEGALHKNKHHMEHAEGLTKKGIPVIDDDGEQQAEIEHSEIIFTLEVTKKLEEYYKIFYSDDSTNKEKEQAALDTGKLLVYQILENTEDRTGLIESCKKGGTITFKKTTDDLIEEALEWVPTVIVVEEETVEKSPKKPEKLSEKEQMKKVLKEILIELLTD